MHENIAVANINTAVNGIELSFDKKPPYEVLKDLKENGFRWHNKKQIWYGRNSAANVKAVEKYVDLDASDVSFGVTPDGMVDIRALRAERLVSIGNSFVVSGDGTGSSEFTITGIDEDGVYYVFADLPEQEPVFVWRDEFDKNLRDGIIKAKQVERDIVGENNFGESLEERVNTGKDKEDSTIADVSSELEKASKPVCMADFYDSVGSTDICQDSTVKGSLWSALGSKGYYKDINAYVWCNYNSAIVIELDNALKRGKTCKRYTVYANDKDIFSYLTNECKLSSPKELYDLVRSGKELPGDGSLTVREDKGVEVFSPFVSVKPLDKLPEKWKKSDLVKAIMSGQVYSGVLNERLTDDYAYDAAWNFGSGCKVDLPGQAADLVEGCRDCYIRTEGVDEKGVASIHFSYAGDYKTFYFDVNCDLAEGVKRREAAARALEAHNVEIKNLVKKFTVSDIDMAKTYVVDKVVEDGNTGKLSVQAEVIQGFVLADRLDYEEITDIREAEFIPNKLYTVAGFFNRREYAEEDARIVDTGNWGQVCSGKAFEELTREGVSLHLNIHDYEHPTTFEAAKHDCMMFISGQQSYMFGNTVDYSKSLQKLEAEEVRLNSVQNVAEKVERRSLADIIGFAEVKKEFEKNQKGLQPLRNNRDDERDER